MVAEHTVRSQLGRRSTAVTKAAQKKTQRQNKTSSTTSSTGGPATKVGKVLRVPSEHALNIGKYAAEDRAKGRDATIRSGFVRSDRADRRPPLARMLVGGRGGEVRLKLYLSMLFIAIAPPYSTPFPTRAWAEMFDLPEPATDGARRIRDALRWLETNQFVHVKRRPGREAEVFLLSDEGTGKNYVRVSKEAKDRWEKLPDMMWSKGWMAALSGRALATLLMLLDYSSMVNRRGKSVWIPPSRAKELYSLSPETWTRGSRELEEYGVLTAEMKYFKESPLASLHRRKEYSLNLSRLSTPPSPTPAV